MSFHMFLLAHEGPKLSSSTSALLETAELLSNWFQLNDDPNIQRFVFGLGIVYPSYNYGPALIILVDNDFLGKEVNLDLSIEEALIPLDSVESVLGLLPPNVDAYEHNCKVLPIKTNELHAAPGDKVFFPPDGRLGPAVTWGQRRGYLVAGHVAPSVNSMAFDVGGTGIGPVLWHNNPNANPSQSKDVDVAVVEALPHINVSGLGASRHFPKSGDLLDLSGAGTSDAVFGFCDFVRFGSRRATYGEVFITERVFSSPGDSGGLVSCQGDIVGSLIGAYNQRNTSVIQYVGYQLQEIRTRGGPNLRL
ncbi:MAG: hypothetical protein AAGF54_20705 [Pseudomonadota bacterium]